MEGFEIGLMEKEKSFGEKVMRIKDFRVPNKESEVTYKRVLGFWGLLLFGIGNTIGASIFNLIGLAYAMTGPSICVGYLISGVISLMTGLSYSELSGRMPLNGSAYSYIYCTLGELPAFVVGLGQGFGRGILGCLLARGFVEYLRGFLEIIGVSYPLFLFEIQIGSFINGSIMAVLLTIICHSLISMGSKESIFFANILTASKVVFVLIIIFFGVFYITPSNWTGFFAFGAIGVY